MFDDGKWSEAIKVLDEVNEIDHNYEKSQFLLSEARSKVASQFTSEIKSGREKETAQEGKLSEIDRIDREIELLVLQQQDNIEMRKPIFDAFHKCESQGNIRCMEFTLKQISESESDYDKLQQRVDNLELQRATLQSGL